MLKSYALYIHIPFCIKKCLYCDFCSFELGEKEQNEYIDYLVKEMALMKDAYGELKIETVFIGGGTPSILSIENMKKVTEAVRTYFHLNENVEYSIETNPGTITKEKLLAYKAFGINRISVGLQAVQNQILKDLGRIHTYEEFIESYKLIREVGFENVNIDLMYGLPNQSEEAWLETLKKIVDLEPEHISAYSLKVEEGTPFEALEDKGLLKLPIEEVDRRNHHVAIDYLSEQGYKQYEISNFAKEHFQCKHNLIYWENKEYIGIGMSAHGFVNSVRYGNVVDFKNYMKFIDMGKRPVLTTELISEEESLFETIMLGLRLNKGISSDSVKERYGITIEELMGEELKKMISEGLLVDVPEVLKFTALGMDISNTVLVRMMMIVEKFFKQY